MPVILPENLIDKKLLSSENIFSMTQREASSQDIRPIRIAIVNLMPNKEETEIQLLKLLSNQALQIEIDLVRTNSHKPKNSDTKRLEAFYKTYDQIKGNKYDAMIITGAPLEKIEYEDVYYWQELKDIFDFAKENVYSTIFICWAAQAALHYFYQIEAELVDEKIFGIYPFSKLNENELLDGFDDTFNIPQSRYSRINPRCLDEIEEIEILAESDDVGLSLAATKDKRFVFSLGHWEYDKESLHREYIRDITKGINIKEPFNYYRGNIGKDNISVTWKSAASLFFSNWINYAVYQETPYNIEFIKKKSVSKFGGSSLSDSKQFKKVKDIINKADDREVIVVSAPGKRHPLDIKITDLLVEVAQSKEESEEIEKIIDNLRMRLNNLLKNKENNLSKIENRFYDICSELGLEGKLLEEINHTIEEIEKSTSKDFILSRGEYLNAKIMSEYLGYKFIDAKEIIYFQDNDVDLEKSYKIIRKTIGKGEKVVVPGFYGNKNGEIKVFNRGGSDFTGSILASALECKVYENWTDVNGIMSSDPNIDSTARRIPRLKYSELKEIIENGAGVYQEEAIKPVMEKNITIKILNTNEPEEEGTLIKD